MVCAENSHFGRIRRSAVDYVKLLLSYLISLARNSYSDWEYHII
jgi:hypothetical protein